MMRTLSATSLPLLLALLFSAVAAQPVRLCAQAAAFPTPVTLTIDMQNIVANVSPTLYGLMTEEINHAYDGGLYAEMVSNRTFQDSTWMPDHWYVVSEGNTQVSDAIDRSSGPSAALTLSLRVELKQADAAVRSGVVRGGVVNEGFWGMALRPHTVYQGSLYAKAAAADFGGLQVALVSNSTGKQLAVGQLPALTTGWQHYEFTLHTGDIAPSADNHLEITGAHAGAFWLDLVSLFPPTYKDRANGNRADLMQRLATMRPKFLRFPGGNYLEGDTIAQRYEWKKTIGPLVDRPTHPSPWSYHSSDGMGLLEFLYWCEDLQMQPVLAVYAGYSMQQQHVAPGPELEPHVQDALDEIEFVTGGAQTRWGSVRARLGHPAPFALTYVEVGNEDNFDNSGSYSGRYAQFYRAIKARYPQLQVIATTPVKGIRPDVVDDHFYKQSWEFFADTHHYDSYDRTGPKIFVGEWATLEGSTTPNMGAALSDAAWMTGMERNSDVIVMAAYAPLLVNVNPGGMQWQPDLIGYTAANSYGSPSYWAQVMFSNHLGTQVPATTTDGGAQSFFYSVTTDAASKSIYVKLVNAGSQPVALGVRLNTAGSIEDAMAVTTLLATNPMETNTIADPERLAPKTRLEHGASADFHITVPAYTIQVLDLKQK